MRKFVISLLLVTALFAYSQDNSVQNPESNTSPIMGKNIISLESGVILFNIGVAQGFILNCGYERLIIPYFGVQVIVNGWFMNTAFIGITSLVNVHILGNFPIDPYIGIGAQYIRVMNTNMAIVDLPAVVGVNAMFTNYIGLKLEGKLYLLSLQYMMTEINLGMVVRL